MKELMAKKGDNILLRVMVDSGGCSGFMYEYKVVTEATEDDT